MKRIYKPGRTTDILFIVILVIHVICWIYYCTNTGIKGDEFFSYGLANGTEDYIFWDDNQLEIHANEGGWIQGSSIESYLQVDQGERFSFDRVWWNQKHDVHPPLYYTLLNIVSSMFVGQYSKWFGKSVSLLFLILTEVLLYRLSVYFLGKKVCALVPGILWGVSYGTFFLGALVRMYAMLGFFCLLLVYCHIKLQEREYRRKDFVFLALTVMAGGLTHYYFYLFLVLYAGLYFLWMIITREEKKRILLYCASIIAGGILAISIFPYMLYHIFGSYRSDDVKSQLLSENFQFREFIAIINENMFNGSGEIVILLFIIAVVIFVLKEKGKSAVWKSERFSMWLLIMGVGILYAAAMMKISISARTAYISPCYAVLELALYTVIIRAFSFMEEKKQTVSVLLLSLAFCILTVPGIWKQQKEEYEPIRQFKEAFSEYSGNDCIFVYDTWNNLFDNQIDLMAQEDEIYCLNAAQIWEDPYPQMLQKRRTNDPIIVFLQNCEETEERIAILEERIGLTTEKVIEGRFCVYLMK